MIGDPRYWRRAIASAACLLAVLTSPAAAQRKVQPMFGVHYGVPLRWSATLAAGIPLAQGDEAPTAFLAAEPGLAGWRVSAGYAHLTGNLGSGYVLRASVLRTGAHPWRAPSRATFVGAEAQLMPIFAIGVRAGGFYRVGGTDGAGRGLFAVDVSMLL